MIDSTNNLPRRWAIAPLGEIVYVNPRWMEHEPEDGDAVSFVRMAAVEEQSGRLNPTASRTWAEVKRGYTKFQEGDVLFAKITPCMENGKAALAVGLLGGRGAGSTEFHVLRPIAEVRPKFVLYFLLQEQVRRDARMKMKGAAGQLRVPPEFLERLNLPLPPAHEQRRIVEEIEKQFTRLEAGVGALKRVQANLKRYRAAVLKAAVEGRLVPTEAEIARREGRSYEPASELLKRILRERQARWEAGQLVKMKAAGKHPKNSDWKAKYVDVAAFDATSLPPAPEGWIWVSIGQVFDVFVGATPSRAKPEYWNGRIPWVSSGEVSFCRIRETREKITTLGLENSSTHLHPSGTVLLGMIGEGKTRGQAAIIDVPACNNQNSAAIRVSETGLPPEYLYRFLESQYEATRKLSSGGNQPALNKDRVQAIPFPLPPFEEQRQIVAELERRLSVIDELEMQVEANLKRAERLRQSILKRAFEGKLVPQDPNDEPASILLERIRAERTRARIPETHESDGQRGSRKAMVQKQPAPRKTILEVLTEANTPLSPEVVFSAAAHQPESVDDFYAELKAGVESGQIEELRSGDDGVLLRVKRT